MCSIKSLNIWCTFQLEKRDHSLKEGHSLLRDGGGGGGGGGEAEDTRVWVGASGENSVFVSLILSGAHLLVGAWFYWLQ